MTAAQRSSAAQKAWETMRARGYVGGKRPPAPPKKKIKLEPQAPIKMPKKNGEVTAEEMMLQTITLLVTIHGIGNYRKIDTESLNITDAQTDKEVNKDWIGVHKKLMNADELKKIQAIGNKARSYIFSRALPHSLKVGIYLLPRTFEEEMEEKLSEFQNEMKPLIESLANKLPEYKKEAKKEQGAQYNESQWPSAEKIRSAFRIQWRFLYIDSAKGLTKAIYERERQKAEAEWAETRQIVQQTLRTQLSAMVDYMVDRLTPTDGRTKIFRSGCLDKLNEFLGTFDARNITNDVQMKVLVDKARSLVKHADVESIRTNEELRDYALHGFETIKTLLDPMIQNKPHRTIILED